MRGVLRQAPEPDLRQAELALMTRNGCSTFARTLALPCSCFLSRCFARPSGSLAMSLGLAAMCHCRPSRPTRLWAPRHETRLHPSLRLAVSSGTHPPWTRSRSANRSPASHEVSSLTHSPSPNELFSAKRVRERERREEDVRSSRYGLAGSSQCGGHVNDLALVRMLHVLGVVLWIGGVAFVTLVLLPGPAGHVRGAAQHGAVRRVRNVESAVSRRRRATARS